MNLSNAVALVTGAGSGIGQATTAALLEKQVRVIATDIDATRLQPLADNSARVLCLPLDVTDGDAVAQLPSSLPPEWWDVDILVNCAGHDIGGRRPFTDGHADRYAHIIETNLIGVMRITHALAVGMTARRNGHIVTIGSSAGHRTEATTSTYTASKHAIHGWCDSLRKDFVGTGVRVTEICPGRVRTNFGYARAETQADAEAHYNAVGQCLTSADVAHGIVYALEQPDHVVVSQLHLMPADQI